MATKVFVAWVASALLVVAALMVALIRRGVPLATVIGTGMRVLGVVLTLAILSHAVLS